MTSIPLELLRPTRADGEYEFSLLDEKGTVGSITNGYISLGICFTNVSHSARYTAVRREADGHVWPFSGVTLLPGDSLEFRINLTVD